VRGAESSSFRFSTVTPEDLPVPFYKSQHDTTGRYDDPEHFPQDSGYIVKEAGDRHHHGMIAGS